ncbi:WbqC family protein [Kiloniella laminariae]|uniref:WbqC family protein n=1 Tax=Kiloniella laminariae TaxID=454162 RepID=UPI00036552BB|nr:WbqC family protein [Kiloniella laminariae]
MKQVAIMQPTFLPWVGYFAMIEAVDCFVFLDNVQYDKRSWQNRNKLKSANGIQLVSVPTKTKGLYNQLINEVQLNEYGNFSHTFLKSLQHNYKKARAFNEIFPKIEEILTADYQSLCKLNIAIIHKIMSLLDIRTEIVCASQLNAKGKKAELLAQISIEVGADHYLSAPGSKDYLEQSSYFEEALVPYSYFQYQHPIYHQLYGAFESHLSALDLLMNEGTDSGKIMRAGLLI